ncbi:phage portal protein [Rhabdaerophilum calidifontis]|uniref:phage portal protein n=1 Tax=Rhabdaerophilum calidifontis TaxID=2604328 RepID=UPI0012383F00|nr:phage portal protein [Rhabdaerophilum calidifontis]
MPGILGRLIGGKGRKKAARPAPFVAFHQPAPGLFRERAGAGLVRAGYHRNAIVHRSVRLVAEAAASVTWTILADGAERRDHPAEQLLRRPNPRQSGPELMEAVYGHLLLSGNAYCALLAEADAPREIHVLRPDRVSVVTGPDGWPAGYEYAVGASVTRFGVEPSGLSPILHLRLFDPLEDHYGFAPLAAAQVALEMHEAASRWNKALLDNSARPSGALVYASQGNDNLSDDQFDRLKAELETAFQGSGNAGRPILLEGGLDWKPLSLTPKDMDFLEARAGAAREIALALGVPPLLLGLPGDNTHANYAEANRAFWRTTVLPLASRTMAAMAHWLQPLFAETLRFEPDLDRIEALAAERAALWKRVGEAPFLTEEEKREALGYGRRTAPLTGTGREEA